MTAMPGLRRLRPWATLLAATCAALAACAQPPAPQARVELFKSLGSRQCSGGGSTLDALTAALRRAGVEVLQAECGHDGRMRAAMCDLPDGRIAIVAVPAAQREAALALGYAPLDAMAQAARTGACP